MQHLEEGTIHAWLDGELPPLEAEQVAKHAAECATCAAAVAEARGIIAGSARIVSALDDVPGGVVPGRATAPGRRAGASAWRRLRFTPGRAALAATILLAVSATLTLRSSRSSESFLPPKADTVASVPLAKPVMPAAQRAAAVSMDSLKTPGPSSSLVNALALRKTGVIGPKPQPQPQPQPQTLAELREVADAVAPRDTTIRVLAKTRAAAQEPAAGASAAAAAPAAPAVVRGNFAAGGIGQANLVSTFEGCYRVSADSSGGSTEVPSGLPASFTLSRPSSERRVMAQRFADVRGDSSTTVVTDWRQLSPTQANVTFRGGAGNARPVSLVLTIGNSVGVASSGDRTTTVRVARSSCPP